MTIQFLEAWSQEVLSLAQLGRGLPGTTKLYFQVNMNVCMCIYTHTYTHTHIHVLHAYMHTHTPLPHSQGAGSALMGRQTRFETIVRGMVDVLDCPLTVKMRTGIVNKNWNAHKLVGKLREWGASLVTVSPLRYEKMIALLPSSSAQASP